MGDNKELTLREKLQKKIYYDGSGHSMKLSYEHTQSPAILTAKEKCLPELVHTWEAGRACGFHAGIRANDERLRPLIESLINIACTQDETFADSKEIAELRKTLGKTP
jgi:hypothetical protein